MLLDQQIPMEVAFAGPKKLADRLGTLDAETIADYDTEKFAALCAETPAVHRFPGSMAKRIQDLARDMIRLSGRSEDDIRIVFTGLRPGEKLYEEVLADSERTRPTHHPKLRIARAQTVESGWLDMLALWLRQHRAVPAAEVRRELRRWMPEYTPTSHAAPLVAVSDAGRQRA